MCWYVCISVGRYFILLDKIDEYLLRPLKHYSLLRTWTSNKIFLHSCRSLATVYQILNPIAFKSSSTSSVQLHRILPILLFPSILAVTNCFHILSLLIHVICPYHLISAVYIFCNVCALSYILYLRVCSYSPPFFFYYGTVHFFTMHFKYSKSIYFFWGHYPYLKTDNIKVLYIF